MFALNKKYQQLKNYTRMLKEFQTQDSGFNPKEAFNNIQIKQKEVLELINSRIQRLLRIYQSIQTDIKEQEEKLSSFNKDSLEDIDAMLKLVSKHLRNLKTLSFTGKELLLAKKILSPNQTFKDINQKSQNEITAQIKEKEQLSMKSLNYRLKPK
ncbi:hypothetical protein BKH45_08600 [Helicobacter sp. 11S03491-1]|nr:hypothetical protein BKH45_08600 [Helicobacter sp. 11S03491-1]